MSDEEIKTENIDNQEPLAEGVAAEEANKIIELEKQIANEKESKLRILADFQNYKKRLEKEKEEFRAFTSKALLGQILEIIADLERALANNKEKTEFSDGVEIIAGKLEALLSENGLEDIKIKVGDSFDAHKMEALTAIPLKEEEKDKDGKITHIDSKGYIYKDTKQVFKTAKVVVGKYTQV